MIPAAEGGLHEARALAGGDEVARDDERVAERGGAVASVIVGGEAEDLVDARRVHQRLRLDVEIAGVESDLAERAGGAIHIERLQQSPTIGEARRAVGMAERGQSRRRRRDLERRVLRGEVAGARDARGVEGDESRQNVARAARHLRLQ